MSYYLIINDFILFIIFIYVNKFIYYNIIKYSYYNYPFKNTRNKIVMTDDRFLQTAKQTIILYNFHNNDIYYSTRSRF